MDKLEQRIQAIRDELEQIEEPDRAAIWGGVQRKIGVRVRLFYQRQWVRTLAASVAILLIAGAGWWAHLWFYSNADEIQVAGLSPQWQQEVQHYQQLVNNKERELRLENIDKDVFGEVLRELKSLDSVQTEFRADFQALPKNERTVETLLRYYEQKIRILELLSKEIQIKQNEKERNTQQRG